jgi:uncharacterized protein (TIGR02147 family)
MSIFEFNDYKSIISKQIELNAKIRGYKTLLAHAAGCQKAFFSHVHRSHVHLTPDHAAGLANYWGLDDLETEYFLVLVDIARAGTDRLKSHLQERAAKVKAHHSKLEERLKNSAVQESLIQTHYYSSWYWSALHIIASIPQFQTAEKMAHRLGLEPQLVMEALKELEKMGLLKRNSDRWILTDRSFHLPKSSPLNEMNHANWRQRALIDVQKKSEDSFHYTSVFSLSRADAKKFQKLVANLAIDTRKLIEPSFEEELFCFNADFFQV